MSNNVRSPIYSLRYGHSVEAKGGNPGVVLGESGLSKGQKR